MSSAEAFDTGETKSHRSWFALNSAGVIAGVPFWIRYAAAFVPVAVELYFLTERQDFTAELHGR